MHLPWQSIDLYLLILGLGEQTVLKQIYDGSSSSVSMHSRREGWIFPQLLPVSCTHFISHHIPVRMDLIAMESSCKQRMKNMMPDILCSLCSAMVQMTVWSHCIQLCHFPYHRSAAEQRMNAPGIPQCRNANPIAQATMFQYGLEDVLLWMRKLSHLSNLEKL